MKSIPTTNVITSKCIDDQAPWYQKKKERIPILKAVEIEREFKARQRR